MKSVLYNISLNLRISFLRKFGGSLDKIAVEVSDEYYYLIKNNNIHQDAISKIIKSKIDQNSKIEDYNKFIYSSRLSSDSIMEQKYGTRSKFILNLFKLIIKIHLDNIPDNKKMAYNEELQLAIYSLNKNFNKIVLYMFKKHFDE